MLNKICGIKRENIETSARYILSNSKIKIVKSHPITLYINSNIGENDGCYTSTSIRVYKTMKDVGSNNWGDFIYYNGGIASGGTLILEILILIQLNKCEKISCRTFKR